MDTFIVIQILVWDEKKNHKLYLVKLDFFIELVPLISNSQMFHLILPKMCVKSLSFSISKNDIRLNFTSILHYVIYFSTKVFLEAFLCVQFVFVIFDERKSAQQLLVIFYEIDYKGQFRKYFTHAHIFKPSRDSFPSHNL